jgi:hypothetical protein
LKRRSLLLLLLDIIKKREVPLGNLPRIGRDELTTLLSRRGRELTRQLPYCTERQGYTAAFVLRNTCLACFWRCKSVFFIKVCFN